MSPTGRSGVGRDRREDPHQSLGESRTVAASNRSVA